MKKFLFVIMFVALVFACGKVVRDDGIFDTITGTSSVSDSGDSGTSSSTTGNSGGGFVVSSTTSTSEGEKFDVFVPPDVLIDEDQCKQIDFLFVIDDSGSMQDEQTSLIASFPGFIFGVLNYVPTVEEWHLGVTTTSYPYGNPLTCKKKGSLVTSTIGAGQNSSNAICGPYVDGFNFMTKSDDLAVSFPCAAQVGTNAPGNEEPIASLVAAMGGFMQAPGQCNEAFSQENSLLVVIIITDEDDQSGSTPTNWYDELVWLKGTQDDIVVLSLCQTETCSINGGFKSVRLMEFTNMFTHGFIGDVCAPSYDQFFYEALAVIQQACAPPVE